MTAGMVRKHAFWWIAPVILLLGLLLAWQFLPIRDWIRSLDTWIAELGAWGILIFAIAYVVLVVLLAPAEIMSMAAGFIFGLWGIPLVVVSATIGATCAFLVGRYFVRKRVKEFTRKRE